MEKCREMSVGAQLYRKCGIHGFKSQFLFGDKAGNHRESVALHKSFGGFLGGWSYLLLEHDTWTRKHPGKTSVPMKAAGNLLTSMGKQGRLWKEIPLREEIKPGAFFFAIEQLFFFFF